ncbi:MAG: S1 RNA-binding domain-containing protein, partial [Chitinivibrionales bacterium]|nr:S1 RNA-binding domain-containing protein [Chitinivibrionales bacterium]
MQDSKQDSFFEEENEGKAEQQELMAMIDRQPEPKQLDLRVGARVKGTVNRVGDDMVYVDLDGKSSAVMKRAELTGAEGEVTVKEGDELDAYIASIEGDAITLTKSMTTTGASKKEELRAAMEEKVPVQGKVTGINKGGLQVRVMGTVGFCPASQVELRYVDDLNAYLGRSMRFVITRVEGKRVVLSRVPLLEQEASDGLEGLEADVESKRVRTGTISRIADFGLFVDTGTGIDGLVH